MDEGMPGRFLRRECDSPAVVYKWFSLMLGLLRWFSAKGSAHQCRRCWFDTWIRRISWWRKLWLTPVFVLEESHGQRSLVGYSLWDCKESDMTEHTLLDVVTLWRTFYILFVNLYTKTAPWSFSSVQSISRVRLFATPGTAARQASLSTTNSRSLLKLMSIELVVPPNHLILCRPLLLPSGGSFPASGSFQVSQFFASRGQSIRASASASVLPVNIQDWFPLGWTGWISFQSKGLSRVFSNTTVQKHQFFGTQPYLWSNSHIHTWLLDKPQLWLDGPLSAKECLCFLICCLGWS